MASELQVTYPGAGELYAVVRRRSDAKVYSTAAGDFATFDADALGDYDLVLTDRSGDFYQGNFPADIAAGSYRVFYYLRGGSIPADDDLLLATEDLDWNGSAAISAPSLSLDSGALVDLASVKRFLRISAAASDDLLVQLINSITVRMERWCRRRFKAADFEQRGLVGPGETLILEHYPLLALTDLRLGSVAALSLTCTANRLRALVQVTTAALRLVEIDTAGDSTTTELTFADYPTVSALVTAAGALTGWTAACLRDAPSFELLPGGAQDALGRAINLASAGASTAPIRVEEAIGVLHLPPLTGREQVLVRYRAGYDIIPLDLQLLACELVAEAFHRGKLDPNLRGEKLGEYSHELADGVALTAHQQARMRPYLALPLGGGR